MGAIAHPIHQLQRFEIEAIFRQMIFNQDQAPAYPAGLRQQSCNALAVARMVQHIDEHANVK